MRHQVRAEGESCPMLLQSRAVKISSVAGKVLIIQKLYNSSQQKVNIAALLKGMYPVNIITSENIKTQKLIVE